MILPPFLTVDDCYCRQMYSDATSVYVSVPKELAANSKKLIQNFAGALAEKLFAAEQKYGYSDGWICDNWKNKCQAELQAHIVKGDPRDVAIYAAFMWAHGWSTKPAKSSYESSLSYLATPYTKYPQGIDAAYRDACTLAARLIRIGVNLYSPIAHAHGIALHGGIDALNQRLWTEIDAIFLDKCEVLIVAHMEGWEQSSGIAHEIEVFERSGRPIFDLDPQTLTMVQRR